MENKDKKKKIDIGSIIIIILMTSLMFFSIGYPLIRYNLHPIYYYTPKIFCGLHIRPLEKTIEYEKTQFNRTYEEGKQYLFYCNIVKENLNNKGMIDDILNRNI